MSFTLTLPVFGGKADHYRLRSKEFQAFLRVHKKIDLLGIDTKEELQKTASIYFDVGPDSGHQDRETKPMAAIKEGSQFRDEQRPGPELENLQQSRYGRKQRKPVDNWKVDRQLKHRRVSQAFWWSAAYSSLLFSAKWSG